MGSLKQEIYGHMAQEHQRLKEANEEIKVLKAKAKWKEAEGAKGFTMKKHIGTQTDHTSSSSGGRNLTTQLQAPLQFGPWASGFIFSQDTDRGPPMEAESGKGTPQKKNIGTQATVRRGLGDDLFDCTRWSTEGIIVFDHDDGSREAITSEELFSGMPSAERLAWISKHGAPGTDKTAPTVEDPLSSDYDEESFDDDLENDSETDATIRNHGIPGSHSQQCGSVSAMDQYRRQLVEWQRQQRERFSPPILILNRWRRRKGS